MLLACHLLRDDDDAIRVTLIEKRPTIGRGMAYSTAQPGHLLNVRATNMSAFADDPLHFCRWLAENDEDAHGEQPGPLTFAQRRVYGRYIAELDHAASWAARRAWAACASSMAQGRTIATTPTSVTIGIDDGRSITGDLAVLATGHEETAKSGPALLRQSLGEPG